MNLSRRSFLAGAASISAAAWASLRGERPNLRVGIVSDIHVSNDRPAALFERALRYFDSREVDAVLISGDLITNGRRFEFERMVGVWNKVFPGDRRSGGARIEKLFITGNHDDDGWSYGRVKTAEEAKTCYYFNREKWWREFFHEDYAPVRVREVRGYKFVLRHWVPRNVITRFPDGSSLGPKPEDVVDRTAEFMAAQTLPTDRPFFYVQHEAPNDTVNASWILKGRRWGPRDEGIATQLLSRYPNAIALSGHSHCSLTDEMSIWQGSFTAVNCSCLCGYCFTAPGRENGWSNDDFKNNPPPEMERFDIQSVNQGLVMEVFDDVIVFERHEFRHGHRLGPDWVVPIGKGAARPYAPAARIARTTAPQFPKDAKVTVWEGEGYGREKSGMERAKEKHAQIYVSFPAAREMDGSPSRGWDYRVKAELVVADTVMTLRERCVFSEGAFHAEEEETDPVVCAFNRNDVPMALNPRAIVRFTAYPRNCWGQEGKGISVEWRPKAAK